MSERSKPLRHTRAYESHLAYQKIISDFLSLPASARQGAKPTGRDRRADSVHEHPARGSPRGRKTIRIYESRLEGRRKASVTPQRDEQSRRLGGGWLNAMPEREEKTVAAVRCSWLLSAGTRSSQAA